MQFLKILFWCLLAFVAAVFTIANWATVPVRLWGGLIADVNLPLLLAVTFLIGFLPTLLYNHAIRWRLRQRIGSCERTIAELRTPRIDPAATPAGMTAPTPPIPLGPAEGASPIGSMPASPGAL